MYVIHIGESSGLSLSLQATNVSYLLCLSATMVGLLPTQCLNTYMGSTLRDMTQVLTNQTDGYILLIVQVSLSTL